MRPIAIGISALLLLAQQTASWARDARELFREAAINANQVSLTGVEVTEYTGRDGKKMVVERRVVRDAGREFSEVTAGPPFLMGQKVIDDGHVRYRTMPEWRMVFRSPDLGGPDVRRQKATEYAEEALRTHDVSIRQEHETIAGRQAIVLVAAKREGGHGTRREVYVDAEKLVILENRWYRGERLVSRTRFTSVDLDPTIAPDTFTFRPDPSLLVLPEPTRIPMPLDRAMAQKLGPLGAPLPPACIPPGWKLLGPMLAHFGKTPVVHTGFHVPPHNVPALLYRRRADAPVSFFDTFFGTGNLERGKLYPHRQRVAWRDEVCVNVLASTIATEDLTTAARKMQGGLEGGPGKHGHRR